VHRPAPLLLTVLDAGCGPTTISRKANGSPLAFLLAVYCDLVGVREGADSGDRFPIALPPEFRPLPVVILLAGRRVPLGKVRSR
jgi:hypothetical protein